jgi:type I restriction enzyme, S subunit
MNNWRNSKLCDLVDIRVSNVDKKIYPNKKRIKLCNYMDAYSNDYIPSKLNFSEGSADLNELNRFSLIPNDVIITKDSETPEDIAVSSVVIEKIDDLVCGYHLAILRPKEDKVYGPFLMHKLKLPQVQKQFFRIASGSTRYGLTIGGIENTEIFIPFLPHQLKIARILITADNIIDKTQNVIKKYKAIKHGMSQDFFTRGIDVYNDKLRPDHEISPELYKQTGVRIIPKRWEIGILNDFCSDFVNGGTPSTKNLSYWQGDIPWITGADFLESFEIGFIRRKITSVAVKNSSTNVIPEGNILLVTRTGVGKIAIAPTDIAISQDITGIFLNREKAVVNYFYYYFQRLVEDFKKLNQGTSINGIIRNDLINWPVYIPKLKEQKAIANKLSNIDQALKTEQNYLAKLIKFKHGLMQDLLTGKKEVSPDPEDLVTKEN